MKPKSIGIVAGGGGPISSTAVLQDILSECQRRYGSCRSYEYPCMNFFSFPYSEMMLANASSTASRELAHSIQQLKVLGMDIIVIPCFTMGSFLTYRDYGIDLIEPADVVKSFLMENQLANPLVLCSERTRKSRYCEQFFECHYPTALLQQQLNMLIEEALRGDKIDVNPLLKQLPYVPIVCASAILNAQMQKVNDPRLINTNKLIAQYTVQRSYEEMFGKKLHSVV